MDMLQEKPNILIVEDDEDINNLLKEILMKKKYNVKQAFSGSEAKLLLSMEKFQLILLDLMLPGITGEELIKIIRQTNNMPIIVISAKDSKESKINLLSLGADDFVSKPFDVDELIARVVAQLRRYTKFSHNYEEESSTLKHKNLQLNKEQKQVIVKEKELILTSKEFAILELLLENPKKVFSRANLFESIWQGEYLGDDNTINVHISNLRSKINELDKDNEYIKTIWGMGFRISE